MSKKGCTSPNPKELNLIFFITCSQITTFLNSIFMITKEQKYNLLVSALEGGSNYWYLIDKDGSDIVYEYSGGTFVDKLWNALLNGRFIPFKDVETKEDLGELSLMGLSHAEILMRDEYPYHYADAVSENDDAITADVFLQLAVMKDVVYG